jgi:adhesin HecA-like repeat protein
LRFGRIAADDSTAGSSVESAGGIALTAGDALHLTGARLSAGGSLSFTATGALDLRATQLRAAAHVTGSAAAMTLHGDPVRSEMVATAGSLVLSAPGALHNAGGLIQGGQRIDGIAAPTGLSAQGAVTLDFGTGVTNQSTQDLGILFGAGGDLVMRTQGDLHNLNGRILANGAITLAAKGAIKNVTAPHGASAHGIVTGATAATAPTVIETRRARPFWAVWSKPRRIYHVVMNGAIIDTTRLATITAFGSMTLQAGGALRNIGGEVNANGGDLHITAAGFENRGLITGALDLQLDCRRHCAARGGGTVAVAGGQIAAAGNVTLTGADTAQIIGGRVFGAQGIALEANRVTLESIRLPLIVLRESGLYNLWSGATARVILRDQGGSLEAGPPDAALGTGVGSGMIIIDSPAALRNDGGTLQAPGGVVVPGGIAPLRRAAAEDLAATTPDTRPIGWFGHLPSVRQ